MKKTFLILQYNTLKSTVVPVTSLLLLRFQTSWAWNKDTVLLYSLQYCTVKYTKAQPLVEDAHTWQCTPDTWTNFRDWICEHTFTSLKVRSLKVRMSGTYCNLKWLGLLVLRACWVRGIMPSAKHRCFTNTSGLLSAFVLPISGTVCPVPTSISLPLLHVTLCLILLSSHRHLALCSCNVRFFLVYFSPWYYISITLFFHPKNSPLTLCPSTATTDLSFSFYFPPLFFLNLFIFIYFYGCVGSSFLCEGFL